MYLASYVSIHTLNLKFFCSFKKGRVKYSWLMEQYLNCFSKPLNGNWEQCFDQFITTNKLHWYASKLLLSWSLVIVWCKLLASQALNIPCKLNKNRLDMIIRWKCDHYMKVKMRLVSISWSYMAILVLLY